MKNRIKFLSIISVLIFELSGCKELSNQGTETSQRLLGDADPSPAASTPSGSPEAMPLCLTQTYREPDAKIKGAIDLLLVVDPDFANFLSPDDLAQSIAQFSTLTPKLDLNIALLVATDPTLRAGGMLSNLDGNYPVLSDLIQDRLFWQFRLSSALKRHADRQSQFPLPRRSLFQTFLSATDGQNLAAARDLDFFRKDAAFLVFFLTDKDDLEQAVPIANVSSRIKDLYPNKPSLVLTVQPDFAVPTAFYHLAQQTQGLAVSLKQEDLVRGLHQGYKLVDQVTYWVDQFRITEGEIDPNTISVQIDGNEVEWTYNEESHWLKLSEKGKASSTVTVSYCKMPEFPEEKLFPSAPPVVPLALTDCHIGCQYGITSLDYRIDHYQEPGSLEQINDTCGDNGNPVAIGNLAGQRVEFNCGDYKGVGNPCVAKKGPDQCSLMVFNAICANKKWHDGCQLWQWNNTY